jgi:hypothetical protein
MQLLFQGAFSGGTLDSKGKGVGHKVSQGWKILDRLPSTLRQFIHRKIPTDDGFVFVEAAANMMVYTVLFDRAFCPHCQKQ